YIIYADPAVPAAAGTAWSSIVYPLILRKHGLHIQNHDKTHFADGSARRPFRDVLRRGMRTAFTEIRDRTGPGRAGSGGSAVGYGGTARLSLAGRRQSAAG